MKKIKPVEDWIIWRFTIKLVETGIIICNFSIFILVGLTVTLRYFFYYSIFGIEEIIAFLAIWLYWLGGVYGSYEKSHISGDLTDTFIKNNKAKKVINILKHVLTVIISGWLAYWSITEYAILKIATITRTTGLHMPVIIGSISITISFCLMFLYEVYHLIRECYPLKKAC